MNRDLYRIGVTTVTPWSRGSGTRPANRLVLQPNLHATPTRGERWMTMMRDIEIGTWQAFDAGEVRLSVGALPQRCLRWDITHSEVPRAMGIVVNTRSGGETSIGPSFVPNTDRHPARRVHVTVRSIAA